MKKFILLIITCSLFSARSFGQAPIDVTETTLKIAGLGGEEVFYFGFAEGDQLIFNFQEVNGKELKEIEIIELPSSSKFMDYKSKKIENKILNISKTGIYRFRFSNSAITPRICKIKIQRIPASEATKNFNTSVYWRTIQDTISTPHEDKYLDKSDTAAVEIYSSIAQISSANALNGNKNSQIVDFVLPENTISWSFYIGTGNEGKAELENAKTRFLQSTAATVSKFQGYGLMAALALRGISYFTQVQGTHKVKFWFLSDANSVTNFNAGQAFMQYKKGDVITEASRMFTPLKGKIYLALKNDNTAEPINVTIKVVAILVNEQFDTQKVEILKVSNRQEPYLKN